MKTDGIVICDFPGCTSDEIEYTSDVWFNNKQSILSLYWCKDHVPEGATKIEDDCEDVNNKKEDFVRKGYITSQ